jgi:hypothetical protein
MGMTMCKAITQDGTQCPMRDDCYRYTREPNPFRQSYFLVAPLIASEGEQRIFYVCEDFTTNKERH